MVGQVKLALLLQGPDQQLAQAILEELLQVFRLEEAGQELVLIDLGCQLFNSVLQFWAHFFTIHRSNKKWERGIQFSFGFLSLICISYHSFSSP
jgi:hypothetical protein